MCVRPVIGLLLSLVQVGAALPLNAQEPPPTVNDYGQTGLIEMPSAWTQPDGWIHAGTTLGEPYRHVFAGVQVLPWLETTLRYSDPGFDLGSVDGFASADLKIVLVRETARWPQIVVGARDLFGEGVLSGEYIAVSRHFRWFDLTVGVGWGRYAGRGALPNPFGHLGDRGDRRRPEDGSSLDTLFGGEEIGLFGGIEARLPVPGLTALIEYSPDDFAFERGLDPNLERPVPVNVGLAWRPWPWLSAGLSYEQGEALMGRVALRFDPGRLPTRPRPPPPPAIVDRSDAPADAAVDPGAGGVLAALDEAGMAPRAVRLGGSRADVWVDRDPALDAATQVGRAARALTAAAPPPAVALGITLGDRGLDVSTVTVMRDDLERAGRHAGSPEELWRDATVEPATDPADQSFGTAMAAHGFVPRVGIRGELRGELGLADTADRVLYRLSLLTEAEVRPWRGLVLGVGGRINLADDLILPEPRSDTPVRSETALFAAHTARLERAYGAWLRRLGRDSFVRAVGGFVDEAYFANEVEVLWRPYARRYAVGARLAQAVRRDPDSQLALEPISVLTGHLDLYYRPPGPDLDLRLSAGRYLGGDIGATAEVTRRFGNGVRIGAHATVSSGLESDPSQLVGGVRLSIPLPVPVASRSRAVLRVEPLLRDAGQELDTPLRLYELTAPVSYEAIAAGWPRVLD